MDPQDAGADRLRPGQPTRRQPRGGACRPDGGGRPRRRGSSRARGRRLGPRGQSAVVALSRSGTAAGTAYSAQKDAATRYTGIGGNVPQTLVNQACLDIQAGRSDVGADRRGRNMAHPQAIARRRRQSRTGRSRTTPCRSPKASDEGIELAGSRRLAHQAGPTRLCLSDVRAGAADRGGRVVGRPPAPNRRAVVAVQRGGRDNPHAWSRERVVGRRDLRSPDPTTG